MLSVRCKKKLKCLNVFIKIKSKIKLFIKDNRMGSIKAFIHEGIFIEASIHKGIHAQKHVHKGINTSKGILWNLICLDLK